MYSPYKAIWKISFEGYGPISKELTYPSLLEILSEYKSTKSPFRIKWCIKKKKTQQSNNKFPNPVTTTGASEPQELELETSQPSATQAQKKQSPGPSLLTLMAVCLSTSSPVPKLACTSQLLQELQVALFLSSEQPSTRSRCLISMYGPEK